MTIESPSRATPPAPPMTTEEVAHSVEFLREMASAFEKHPRMKTPTLRNAAAQLERFAAARQTWEAERAQMVRELAAWPAKHEAARNDLKRTLQRAWDAAESVGCVWTDNDGETELECRNERAAPELLASCIEFLPILERQLSNLNLGAVAETSSAFQYAKARVERMRAAIAKATARPIHSDQGRG